MDNSKYFGVGYYRPQTKFGVRLYFQKHVSVILSTVGEGVHGRDACVTGVRVWQGVCVCGKGCAWQGACMAGAMHARGHVRTNKAQFYYQALNILVKKLIFYHHQGLQ